MDWDLPPQPDTTPIGDGRPDPVEAPAPDLSWVGPQVPGFVTVPPTVRRPDEDDAELDGEPGGDLDAQAADEAWEDDWDADDTPRSRPVWMLVVAVVLLITFVGWAITTVVSQI